MLKNVPRFSWCSGDFPNMFQDFLIFPKNLDDFQAAALHPNPHPPRPRLVRMARRRKIMSALLLLYSAVAAITWTFKASRWGSCNQCSMSSQSLRTLSCLWRDIDNGRVFRGIVPRTLGASIIVFSHCVCWNVGKAFTSVKSWFHFLPEYFHSLVFKSHRVRSHIFFIYSVLTSYK